MSEFTERVKQKLKSRSWIYAILFIVLIATQWIYQSYQEEQAAQQAVSPAIENDR
jgi:hypothetical protein